MGSAQHRKIEKVPGRSGGRAVIGGTRIRVSVVLACYRRGMSVDEIVAQFPQLSPADVHGALAYAFDRAEEIEADLSADNEESVRRQFPESPPDA